MSESGRYLRGCFVGAAGFVVFAAVWFIAGTVYLQELGKRYPPGGTTDLPSLEVVDAGVVVVLMSPLAGLAGAVVAVVLAGRLRRRSASAGR